jgi:hypothetical protein
MADSGVYDRWHKANPKPGEPRCREHRKVSSAAHGQGKRWQARWRDETGQQRAKNFKREADADHAVGAFKVDLQRGSYTDPRAGRVLFRDRGEQWRAAQVHRATTAAQVETHLRRHVYPTFGDRSLGSIRPSEVQAWVRGLERDLAPSTIGVVYSFVAGIFRTAVRDRIIVASPCVDIRLPKLEPKRVEPLATKKVEALIEAMPSRYRALVVLAAGTGLRQGEAFAVEVEAVDWLRRTLRVDRQLVLLPGGEPYIAPPKTPASHPDGAASPDRRRRAGGPPGDIHGRAGRDPGRDPQAGPEAAAGHAGVYRRDGPAAAADPVLGHLAACGGHCRARQRGDVPRPAPLLREPAHPPRRERQSGAEAPRPQERGGDPRHLLPPLARLRGPHPRGG